MSRVAPPHYCQKEKRPSGLCKRLCCCAMLPSQEPTLSQMRCSAGVGGVNNEPQAQKPLLHYPSSDPALTATRIAKKRASEHQQERKSARAHSGGPENGICARAKKPTTRGERHNTQ
ncbi:hypothetical protein NDU88_002684 [Pleurodeles waltl]|uniref:Uncharacterized protein n=1 Tax=Pleurodeles waltl TaxID=8319 RepID=A0AAV7UAE4_PLEWA|nr:hypothetical protein NDU88_002684 [Pleurodeles waltl]